MTYREQAFLDTVKALVEQFPVEQRINGAKILLEGTDHEVTKIEKADDLLSHLAGWAPGNLQAHLIHDHNALPSKVPYNGPLNEIHAEAHAHEEEAKP